MTALLILLALQLGPRTVGVVERSYTDTVRDRTFRLLVWLPDAEGGRPATLADYGAPSVEDPSFRPVARFDATASGARWPLVLYAPMPLEEPAHNWRLMEHLASYGYAAAAYSPYGIRPGFMDVGPIDLLRQAEDVQFLRARLLEEPFTAPGPPVLIGHSWGGLVMLASQLRSPSSGIVSLDGSEEYWRDVLEGLPEFDLSRMRAPYLRVTTGGAADFGLFQSLRFSSRYRHEASRLSHSELAANPLLRSLTPAKRRAYDEIVSLVRRFVDGAVGQADFASEISVDRIRGERAPPTEEELLEIFLREGVDAVLELLDELETRGLELYAENGLTRFAEQITWTRRYPDESETILERLLLLYPRSTALNEHLGNHFWMAGDAAKARAAFERALALGGANLRILQNLHELRSR